MSFLFVIVLIAFLVFVVVVVRAVRRYRSESHLLPTNRRRYSDDARSRPYRPPVETRSCLPHSTLSSTPYSGFPAPQNGFTIQPQQSPRKLPHPPTLSPLPVAVRKPQQYRDDLPVASIEQVRRPDTKAPGQKTVVLPLKPVYRPSPELPSCSRKPQQYSFLQDELPGFSVEHVRRSAAKSPVRKTVEPCIKPQRIQSFGSQDEETLVDDEEGEDDDEIRSFLALRKLANQERENMRKCRTEENLAKRSRQFIRAREFKIKAQGHAKRMQELDDRASDVIFARNNKDPTLHEIDLHRLKVKEAIDRTSRILKQARELGNREIRIIVGKGIHSKDGLPKLKPAIQAFLEKNQFPVEVDPRSDGGALVVRLDAMPASGS